MSTYAAIVQVSTDTTETDGTGDLIDDAVRRGIATITQPVHEVDYTYVTSEPVVVLTMSLASTALDAIRKAAVVGRLVGDDATADRFDEAAAMIAEFGVT